MPDSLAATRLVADPLPPTGVRAWWDGLTGSERLLVAGAAIGFVHHVDHVLRYDHSGWPFVPEATPFTFSLAVYPVLLIVLLARSWPWLRVGLTALVLVAVQTAHVFVETPYQQYANWAYHVSTDPGSRGANLLGIASPALGVLAAGWSILLSVVLVATLVAFVLDARRAGEKREMG